MTEESTRIDFDFDQFGKKTFKGLDDLYDAFERRGCNLLEEQGWIHGILAGVPRLLRNHKHNKSVLRDILSRHPNWFFKEHAIIQDAESSDASELHTEYKEAFNDVKVS